MRYPVFEHKTVAFHAQGVRFALQLSIVKGVLSLSSEHTVHFSLFPFVGWTPYEFPFVECKEKPSSVPLKRNFFYTRQTVENNKSRQKPWYQDLLTAICAKRSTQPLYQRLSASMVEARGVEPLSEIASTRISPGAVWFSISSKGRYRLASLRVVTDLSCTD